MKVLIRDLKGMNRYQWLAIIIISIFLTVTSFVDLTTGNMVWEGKQNWQKPFAVLSGVAAFTGIMCVFQVSRGKLSNFYYGLINVVLYGMYAFTVGYTGDAILNIFFFLPCQLFGFFAWKNKMSRETVENNKMHIIAIIFYSCILAVLWGSFYYLIPVVDDSLNKSINANYEGYPYKGPTVPHILDSFTNAASITAQLLMLRRFKEQWYLWIAVNIAQITMYCGINGFHPNPPMIVMWLIFFANSIYGFLLWKRREHTTDILNDKLFY